jgi:hypothetical protein
MQFSLRLLLAAIAAVGIGAALWAAEPSWQVGILQSLVVMAAPACILTAAMHQQGANRAFLLGATFVATISTVTYSYQLANECRVLLDRNWTSLPVGTQQMFLPDGLKASSVLFKHALFQWSFAPFVGLFCVFTHWLLLRPPEPKD